jgi:tetratricopeptide (TPR) repeat protein
MTMMTELCGDDELQELMAAIASDDSDEIAQIDRALARYPDDPRLHFLRGSVLAGIGRPIEALASLKAAVALAPGFDIARFQLGFFQLTSGEAADALGTWGPLALLPDGHYLRLFVTGLTHLIRDEFAETIATLTAGIAANQENPPLNRDMQLIIDKVRDIPAPGSEEGEETISATSLLLGQFGGRPH